MTYTREKLIDAVSNSNSIADVQRAFGKINSGSSHQHIKRKLEQFNIDISHFTGKKNSVGFISKKEIEWVDILIYDRCKGRREASYRLRRAMVASGIEYRCLGCSNKGYWEGENLTLEIDHINENRLDNTRDNLRFLCPNCHSLRGVTIRIKKV